MSMPPEPPQNGGKPQLSTTRVVIWIVVAGIAIYLIASGVVGIIAKG